MRWILSVWLIAFVPLSIAATVHEDPLDRQTLDIAKELRCTVCQNQPVSESNADLARDMRALIREQLKAGKSRAQIMQYFVDRYGDYVLLKPPFDPFGALLWVVPPLLLAGIGVFAWRYQRRRLRPAAAVPVLSAEDRARVHRARSEGI